MYENLEIDPKVERLKGRKLFSEREELSFSSDPKVSARLTCLGLHQEIGTVNDQLNYVLVDAHSEQPIPKALMRSSIIECGNYIGLRVWVEGCDRLAVSKKGLRSFFAPQFSFNTDGTIKECVVFPELISKILGLEEAELIIPKPWAEEMILRDFNRNELFYQYLRDPETWPTLCDPILRYAKLLTEKKLPFLATHDLVFHLSGFQKEHWPELQSLARESLRCQESYFAAISNPTPYNLVLPYLAGYFLDTYAQPGTKVAGIAHLLRLVIDAMDRRRIDPSINRKLVRFPQTYDPFIRCGYTDDLSAVEREAPNLLANLILEINENSAS